MVHNLKYWKLTVSRRPDDSKARTPFELIAVTSIAVKADIVYDLNDKKMIENWISHCMQSKK